VSHQDAHSHVFQLEGNSLTDGHKDEDETEKAWSRRPFSNWRNWWRIKFHCIYQYIYVAKIELESCILSS